MPHRSRSEEEEKDEMSCEDPLLDEMLMKAERLRMAMLFAANPIPDTIETRHGDNITECSSVGYSTVFSKVLRTDHPIAKTKAADVPAPPTASFRDNNSRRQLLGVTTEEEEEKTVDEGDAAVETPAVGQRKTENEDASQDQSDDDDNHVSPVALSAPDLDVDASSAVAIQFASEWQSMTAKTRTIARMGDVDFSPVADYSSRSVNNTVRCKQTDLASTWLE